MPTRKTLESRHQPHTEDEAHNVPCAIQMGESAIHWCNPVPEGRDVPAVPLVKKYGKVSREKAVGKSCRKK